MSDPSSELPLSPTPLSSQITLVNPSPPLELVLSHPSTILNTKLLLNSTPWFQISTTDRDAAKTQVRDLRPGPNHGEVVASIHRRSIFSDKVKLKNRFGGKGLKKDEWIRPGRFTEGEYKGRDVWTVTTEHGIYHWRWDPKLRIVLFSEDPNESIAYVKEEPGVFALVVERAAEDFLDEIIPGFIILEHTIRMDTKVHRVYDGWQAENRAPMGYYVN